MHLRFRFLGRNRSKAEAMLYRIRFPHRHRRGDFLPGWRDEYRWNTVLVIALGIWLFIMGLWVTTHPID
jgi:hypothetical protein